MQESHQMGLDTRENAMPVIYDTGDTDVTSPAEPEWGGNARGATFSPMDTSPHPTPPTCPPPPPVLSISLETPSPQKLQDDTGILPSLHACKELNKYSLAGKVKLGRVSWNGSKRRQRTGAWF